ncbi:hypothetical protein K435DRAFT_877407 [Dendrothele bispora CBS 962.96]|uniref:Bacteriophage T5 Orf172 DNA-binding domain-containing protein n=1 Tax=Dendrothele bispora (strain CBS 962.96) TaxID=1314807 RepID=A0A4S8KQ28_DENBC|nr:hypothetical protein K435DRAFT_877407 [Dendrothele bispora CBS 962.96]
MIHPSSSSTSTTSCTILGIKTLALSALETASFEYFDSQTSTSNECSDCVALLQPQHTDFPSLLCFVLKFICRPLKELKPLQPLLLSPLPHTRQKSSSHQCSKNRLRHSNVLTGDGVNTVLGALTKLARFNAATHSHSASDGHDGTMTYKIGYTTRSVKEHPKELQRQCPSKNYKFLDADKCLFVKRTEKVVHDVLISKGGHTHREVFDLGPFDGLDNAGKDVVVRVREIVEGVYTV